MTFQPVFRKALWAMLWVASERVYAQPALPEFEVASIRQHVHPMRTMMNLKLSGPRVTMDGYNVVMLVMEAFGLRGAWQVSVTPARAKDEFLNSFYDIVARAPGEGVLTRDECRRMLQSLLIDRFKLRSHREMKDMPVYALTRGKTEPKLEESKGDGDCSINVRVVTGGQSYSFSKCSVRDFVGMLGQGLVDRPVLDETGLTGKYDFRWIAMPDFMNRNQTDPAAVSPFTAVQDLGLKLQAQKAVIQIVMVDGFEKPTEN